MLVPFCLPHFQQVNGHQTRCCAVNGKQNRERKTGSVADCVKGASHITRNRECKANLKTALEISGVWFVLVLAVGKRETPYLVSVAPYLDRATPYLENGESSANRDSYGKRLKSK